MKRRLLKFTLVMCFILITTALFAVSASAETYGDLTYSVSGGKVTITDCNESATSVTIPSTIDGYPVTSIGGSAFEYCTSLTSISIPDSVTSIGSYAFSGCTSLTSVNIPDSVTSIGSYAFFYCSSLTSISIGDSVTSIGSCAFYYCTSLTSISIGNGVTSIGRSAFKDCYGLKNITIPDSVTSIGEYAFSGCYELKNITIPNMVTNIGSYAFYNCTNLNYNIYKNACYLGNSSNPYLVLVKAISTSITSCTINTNARFIYSFAFSDCMSITSITIPNNVTSIGGWAFECSGITSIAIPGSVTSIGGYAFYDCNELVTVYYCGTAAQWSNISISAFNYDLIFATRSYHKYVYSLTEPTCTENGAKTEQCEFCDLKLSSKVIPKLGHEKKTHNAKAPTCTDIGWNAYVTCSRCDYSTYAAEAALGHDEITHNAKAPTCTEIGWDAYVTCSRCGYCTYVELSALGHSYSEWDMFKEPDEDGYCIKSRVCSACGNEEHDTVLFASGDVDGDGTLTNTDITLAIRAMSGWNNGSDMALVDSDYDGKITNRDIIVFIQKLAGQEPVYPVHPSNLKNRTYVFCKSNITAKPEISCVSLHFEDEFSFDIYMTCESTCGSGEVCFTEERFTYNGIDFHPIGYGGEGGIVASVSDGYIVINAFGNVLTLEVLSNDTLRAVAQSDFYGVSVGDIFR